MAWGAVELQPEVRDWLESLSTRPFATAAFYIDLVADRGPLLLDRVGSADRAADGVREDADAGRGRG